MPKDRGLGRGLDSLIPTKIESEFDPTSKIDASTSVAELEVSVIAPNPHQPRQVFDEGALNSLAESLKTHGVIQPLVVMPVTDGKYQLVAGERRLRAAKLAGLKTVPVISRTLAEQQQLEVALIENLQRQDLNPIEVATAYRKLVDQFNLPVSEIAKQSGKDHATIVNTMRLLGLPLEVKRAIAEGQITEGHGRAILMAAGEVKQLELLELVINNHWTVRQTENAARGLRSSTGTKATAVARQASSNPFTEGLSGYLKTKVSLLPSAKGGRLIIEYTSDEELERLYKRIKREG